MKAPLVKSKDFRGSARRLLATLKPERFKIVFVMLMSIISVGFAIAGPKILGEATNILFAGVTGAQFPAGTTQEQVAAGLRAAGQNQLADMLSGVEGEGGSVVAKVLPLDADGRTALLVPDDTLMGRPALLVLRDDGGTVVASRAVVIGG